MAKPRQDRFTIPRTNGRDYLNAFMHLIEAIYWAGIVGALIYTDASLWVWGLAAILAIPTYVIATAVVRSRLGILRRA